MNNFRAIVLLALVWATGCIQESDVKLQEDQYYDLKGLLDNQTHILDSLGKRLQKKAIINGESDTTIISMNHESWEREFEIFREADLNKPFLRDRYEVVDSLSEQTSNLKVLQYHPKDSISSGVKSFKIFYLDSLEDVRKIQIKMVDNNPIYNSQKYIEMQFADQNRQLILKEILLRGYQKMILTDSVKFRYQGTVLN